MNSKRSKQTRRKGFRFQPRDAAILQAIHENDGVLARRHIKEMFWLDKSQRAMERRLSKLYHAGYIAWPSQQDYREKPIPEPICWLGWRGALSIAGQAGVAVPLPKNSNENQLRELHQNLRKAGFRWVRWPRWSLLRHDLAVVDFKLVVLQSLNQLPRYHLEWWIPESTFRMEPDQVVYEIKRRDGSFKKIQKGVCPDACFEIIDKARRMEGDSYQAWFLLEMDMSTHDNPSFGREKAAAGAAYIHSQVYKKRFGKNTGRWLMVTAGSERRLKNLMKYTRQQVPARDLGLFYFSTISQLKNKNVFCEPIWQQAHKKGYQAIFKG